MQAAPNTPTVLFLCTGNYYRSRYAEVLFNHLARERNLPWRADSRGLHIKPGHNIGPLSEHALRACATRGLLLSEPLRMPMPCSSGDLENSRLVVALKESEHRAHLTRLFPGWETRVRYWHVGDVDVTEAEDALAEIDELVRSLVDELAPLAV
jgi:protein-tyrosine phosphatase